LHDDGLAGDDRVAAAMIEVETAVDNPTGVVQARPAASSGAARGFR
jgi:hypothetical protein